MLELCIVAGVAFLLQGIFSFAQMRHLSDEFIKLRRRGKVAFGRKSGGFHAGAVVMFLVDDDGIIQEGRKLEGITAFARTQPLDGFEGRFVGDLTADDGPKNHKNLRAAIADAALTYRAYTAGETIADPPSPFQRIASGLAGLGRKQAATK